MPEPPASAATTGELAAAVSQLARRLGLPARHGVASPLGAWLLLALCVTADASGEVAEVLGQRPGAATAAADALLADPHPVVASAAAVWTRRGVGGGALREWLGTLPREVTTGELTDQAALDAWVREKTWGLIDRFPLQLDPWVLLVLATALATRVSWAQPFELAPASALGAGSGWAGEVEHVLRAPAAHGELLAATGIGDVGVHSARSRDGLLVTSAIADPARSPADVLAACHDLAIAQARGEPVARRDLFELPLGDHPWGVLAEGTGTVTEASGRGERFAAVLPAWEAHSDHELTHAPGFVAAARALMPLVGGTDYVAKQSALARYTRVGFEAAAVTAMAVRAAFVAEREGRVRTAELRFAHPYAVVAVVSDQRRGAWHGVPVFCAWVGEVVEATE